MSYDNSIVHSCISLSCLEVAGKLDILKTVCLLVSSHCCFGCVSCCSDGRDVRICARMVREETKRSLHYHTTDNQWGSVLIVKHLADQFATRSLRRICSCFFKVMSTVPQICGMWCKGNIAGTIAGAKRKRELRAFASKAGIRVSRHSSTPPILVLGFFSAFLHQTTVEWVGSSSGFVLSFLCDRRQNRIHQTTA